MSTTTVSTAADLVFALKTAQSGDTILLAPGSYGAISISGVNIAGNVTIASADASNPAVLTSMTVAGSSGLTFHDLELNGAGLSPFMISKSQNITLTDLDVHGSLTTTVASQTAYGLEVSGSSNVTVSNSQFYMLKMGIVVGDGSSNVTISNNSFTNIMEHGVHGGVASNITISNNYFSDFYYNAGVHPDAIIFDMYGSTAGASNIVVTNNVIARGNGLSTQGIFLNNENDPVPFSNVTIADNLVIGEGYNGIDVCSAAGLVSANGVQISGNVLGGYSGLDDWIRPANTTNASVIDDAASTFCYTSNTNLAQSNDSTTAVVSDGGAAMLSGWLAANPGFSAAVIQAGDAIAAATVGADGTSGGGTVNGPPVIAVPGAQVLAQGVAAAIAGVSLSETGTTTGETFTVTLSDTSGLLSATGTGVSASSPSITLTGSLSQVNADLATLTDLERSSGADTITIKAVDSLGGVSAPASIVVTTKAPPPPVNGPPVVAVPGAQVLAQGVAAAIAGISLSETGTTTGETFTVTLTDTSGQLSAVGTGVSGSGAASITLTGSLSQVNADLATLTDLELSSGADTITIKAVDSLGGVSAPASIAVTAKAPPPPVSGPPVIAVPGAQALAQGVATTIAGVSLSEANAAAGETFIVRLSDSTGLLSAAGLGVSGSGTTSLTIAGSLSQVDADLATLADTTPWTAGDTITVSASDSLGQSALQATIAVTTGGPPPGHGHNKPKQSTSSFVSSMSTLAGTSGSSTQTSGGLTTPSGSMKLTSPHVSAV